MSLRNLRFRLISRPVGPVKRSDFELDTVPVALGEVMRALGVGRAVASNDPGLAVGDTVVGLLGVQDYAVVRAAEMTTVDPRLAPLPRYLGALGMPGMTAYFGLLDVGRPRPGE